MSGATTVTRVLPACTRQPGVSRARWAELYLWIRTDHTPPRLMPFRRTKSQRILRQRTAEVVRRARAEHQGAHIFLVKPRRFKATSEWLAEIFSACATERLTEALILAQTRPDSEKILRAMHLFYDKLPGSEKPSRRAENKSEFDFDELGSYIGTGTANAISSGRGGGLQFGLNDEAAWSQLKFDDAEQLFAALSEACRYGLFLNQSTPRPTGWFRDKVEALAAGRDKSAYLITTTHWEDDENRLPVTPQEISEIYETLTDEEKTRAKLAGFNTTLDPLNGETEVWERLKWRRRKWAKLGRLAPQEYIEDLTSCWVARGEYFYDPDALAKHMLAAKDATPIFEQQVSEDATGDGIIRLWEEYDPQSRYVVITDSSTGSADGDPAISVLWNLRTMRQAGEVHCRVRPKIMAHLTYKHLCKKYGLPLWVPERNHPGPAIIDAALYDIQYPNLYRSVKRDKTVQDWADKWGWNTSPYTRVAMLESSRDAIAEGSITVLSDRIIGDCSRFKLKQLDSTRYRYEAEGGAHDEGPIVLGILTQVILEGSTTVPTVDFITDEESSPWQ